MNPVIFIIVILAVAFIWFATTKRKLVNAQELCENALSTIGVQQTSRWDAITSLVKLTEKYAAHESATLAQITAMRRSVTKNSSPTEINDQEHTLNEVTARIVAVGEAYPELKSNTLYLNAMDSWNAFEKRFG